MSYIKQSNYVTLQNINPSSMLSNQMNKIQFKTDMVTNNMKVKCESKQLSFSSHLYGCY